VLLAACGNNDLVSIELKFIGINAVSAATSTISAAGEYTPGATHREQRAPVIVRGSGFRQTERACNIENQFIRLGLFLANS